MTGNEIAKIEILIHQKRHAEAEGILKNLLGQDPDNVHYLALLAEVNLQRDDAETAGKLIDSAIGLAPDEPWLFYIRSRVALLADRYDDADEAIQQAIALDPGSAGYFALRAMIKLNRKRYDEALSLADHALSLDAENVLALNTRSTALVKLNRKEEAFTTIEGALREDPENAYTHTNYGWGLLEKGDSKKALVHFREALKSDPNFHFAKAGMAEALKANNPFYRLFLQYSFWIGNLTAKYQWGVIIGFYLLTRILRGVAESSEALRPYLLPVVLLFSFVAFSTWVITPLSNLFLRLNPFGRYLLTAREIMSSNFVGISVLVFLTGLLLYLFAGGDQYLAITAFGFVMMVPLSTMFAPSKQKYALVIYAIGMAVVGLAAIITVIVTGELFNLYSAIFLFGFIVFQWVSNFLVIRNH
ncbi:tetratricopeptide repeat protein [Hufsiella ginkgonis]|uniref:Tetratricopeptide repeat protein n=1 Tax=Hufsiella ginkgonis TaxID=2695274 RepID=A0A7K1Y0M6_9SPHI|nr:tetratricopeptide repeat protein [Hufsiella ginkgonis]MXV16785.1 tetratricopeptide repeat protein [Hufsiella ginkgonis]